MKQLVLPISPKLLDKINKAADTLDLNKEEFILKIIKKYLLLNEIENIRKKMRPIIKKQGFKKEEDLFRAIS